MSCDKVRNELTIKRSALFDTMTLILCKSCVQRGLEPRFAVVLAAREQGIERVKFWIANGKYIGAKITADELI
jgi:hypothetical protein